MTIHFSDHARLRLSIRRIAKQRIIKVLVSESQRYYDVLTRYHIAVENLSGSKALVVVYQEFQNEFWVITAHPLSKKRISVRVEKGRWIKI